jgi:hypothetical protein
VPISLSVTRPCFRASMWSVPASAFFTAMMLHP